MGLGTYRRAIQRECRTELRVDEGVVEDDVIENIAFFETAQTEAITASASVTARSPVLRLNKSLMPSVSNLGRK